MNNYASTWSEISDSWRLLLPPWKPSAENIGQFKSLLDQAIQKNKNPKVLILGATPEIRDLLAEYPNCKVTIVDFNIEMILAMNNLVKTRNFSNEVWIKSDWLAVPVEHKYFDFIIGDYVTSQLIEPDLNRFYEKIKHLLKDTGRFVTRIIYYDPAFSPALGDLLEKYEGEKLDRRAVTNLVSEMCVSFIEKRKNNYVFSLPKLESELEKYRSKHSLLATKIDRIFSPYTKEWFFLDLPRNEQILRKHFAIENILDEPKNSILFRNTKIYQLKRSHVAYGYAGQEGTKCLMN